MLHTDFSSMEKETRGKVTYGISVSSAVNKYSSRYVLPLCLSASRYRADLLTFGHAFPIYDVRVLRHCVNLGILRSEAPPKRIDHPREPVY